VELSTRYTIPDTTIEIDRTSATAEYDSPCANSHILKLECATSDDDDDDDDNDGDADRDGDGDNLVVKYVDHG